MPELTIASLVFCAFLVVLYRRIRPSLISPLYALIVIYLTVLVSGLLFYDPTYRGISFVARPTTDEYYDVLWRVLILLSSCIAGALIASLFQQQKRALRRSVASLIDLHLSRSKTVAALLFCCVAIALIVFGVGPENLWYQQIYLVDQNKIVLMLGEALAPAAGFVLGVVAVDNEGVLKRIAITLFLVFMVLSEATATRRFAILPVLFALGMVTGRPQKKSARAALVLSILALPLIIVVPLVERSRPERGISTILSLPDALSQSDMESSLRSALNNVAQSLPLTVVSARPFQENATSYIGSSVNPLPGLWTDWYDKQVRINYATPCNALGDLLRGGMFLSALYFFVVGALFTRVDIQLRTAKAINPRLLLIVALGYAFSIMSLQYPLRLATRFLYYMLLIEAVAWLLRQYKNNRANYGRGIVAMAHRHAPHAASSRGECQ